MSVPLGRSPFCAPLGRIASLIGRVRLHPPPPLTRCTRLVGRGSRRHTQQRAPLWLSGLAPCSNTVLLVPAPRVSPLCYLLGPRLPPLLHLVARGHVYFCVRPWADANRPTTAPGSSRHRAHRPLGKFYWATWVSYRPGKRSASGMRSAI
jgi:hypothetical protein